MDATTENIDHLSKSAKPRATLMLEIAIVSHMPTYLEYSFATMQRGLRADGTKSLERISTNCGSLVPLATKVQQTCQVDNFYTFGMIGGSSQNASDWIDFHLVVAGETIGYPIE
ncbi:hypothetical protein N7534_005564 [Penicillium rubens]|nr:hypothetical protein N7534_005564 [Penicillium rubens]